MKIQYMKAKEKIGKLLWIFEVKRRPLGF